MKNNRGIILKDIVFVTTLTAIIGLSIFMGWYFIDYTMRIETARNVGQEVEVTTVGYYRNFLLRPDEYAGILFDLSNKDTDLYIRLIGRKPEAGEVFIRPITDLTAAISIAAYYDSFCATKYYRETKFDIQRTDAASCILDEAKIGITKKEYSDKLNNNQDNNDANSHE